MDQILLYIGLSTYIINVEVELVRDHSELGKFKPSRYFPGFVARISAMPNKGMQPANLDDPNIALVNTSYHSSAEGVKTVGPCWIRLMTPPLSASL